MRNRGKISILYLQICVFFFFFFASLLLFVLNLFALLLFVVMSIVRMGADFIIFFVEKC